MWMWDHASMQQELENVGFREVRRAKFGDSNDAVIAAVESIGGITKSCVWGECG